MATTTANGATDEVSIMLDLFISSLDRLKPAMLSKEITLLSILFIIQWHIRYRCGCCKRCGRPGMKLRRVALNLLIFQIYYSSGLQEKYPWIKGRPFCVSAFVILFDNLGFFFAFLCLGWCMEQWKDKDECACCMEGMEKTGIGRESLLKDQHEYEKDPTEEDANDDGIDDDTETANGTYMDVTRDFFKTLGIWVVQSMLVAFYIDNLNRDTKSKSLKDCHVGNWICAVLLQLYVGDKQLGGAHNTEFWRNLWTKGGKLKNVHPDMMYLSRQNRCLGSFMHACCGSMLPFKVWWSMRWFFDGSINIAARSVIMFTFPIMLGREPPLDFVKDCLAVLFITTLDDVDKYESKTIDHMMIILKFRLYMGEDHKDKQMTEEDKACVLTKDEVTYIEENADTFVSLATYKKATVWNKMVEDAYNNHSSPRANWYEEACRKKVK